MAKKPQAPKTPEEEAAEAVEQASVAEALEDYDNFVQAQAATIWQYDELPFDLTLEEQLFVRSYVIDRNPVACMRRLGFVDATPATLKARSKKLLAKVIVQEAVEWQSKRMMDKLDITAEKVQRAIAAVAFFDPREVMEFDKYGVRLMNSRYWTEDQMRAVQSIKMGQNGIEIKMYDRLKATEMLSKQLDLMPDDSDAAAAARLAADEAMTKIGNAINRLLPAPEVEEPESKEGPTIQ